MKDFKDDFMMTLKAKFEFCCQEIGNRTLEI